MFKQNEEDGFYLGIGLGMVLMVLSLLGLGDVLEPGLTGFFGKFFGSLENVIGFLPSLIAFLALFVVGFVIDFWELAVSFFNDRKE
ncbi:TPA: hypothetical protein DEX28_01790, partial [Patescibacteria group bacterium]|nr:hypothetical protein [Patescibacteria group bacterium]